MDAVRLDVLSHDQKTSLSFAELLWLAGVCLAPFDAVLLLPYRVFDVHLSVPRLTVIAAIAATLLCSLWTGRVKLLSKNLVFTLFLAWWGLNFASGLWAVNHASYIRYVGFMAFNGLFVLSISHIATSPQKLAVILKCVGVSLLVCVLFGLIEVIWGYRLPASRQWTFQYEITSVFVNPIHFGAALTLFAPFVLAFALSSSRAKIGTLLGAAITLIIVAYLIVRTGSRGAVLGGILGCGTVVFVSFARRRTFIRLAAFCVLVTVLIVLAVRTQLFPVVPSIIVDDLVTLKGVVAGFREESRWHVWTRGLDLWMESPVVGWGAGAASVLLEERGYWLGTSAVHFWGIEVLVNTGLLGGMLWLSLILATFLRLSKLQRDCSDPYEQFLASSLLGGVVASTITSLTIGSLANFPLFWIHLGLCVGISSGWRLAGRR